ncbi:MAG: response regulator [Desulfobacteraceae bacterium]|nr:MAG: response regulator [Desulfobacteraceae bacterium]
MDVEKVIRGKKILIVEDEKDVIEVLIDLLGVCKIDAASSFADGKRLLERNDYDLAVLDIMGVNGFDLLRVANERKIPALMLTAHALSEENLKKSAREGASYYAPKDEMNRIATFVADVLDSIRKNKSPWMRVLETLGDFYDTKFGGTDWRDKELEELIRKAKKHL